MPISLGFSVGGAYPSAAPMTPAEFVAAVDAAVTTRAILGFYVAGLGRDESTTPGRVKALANQLGVMPTLTTSSTTVEPAVTVADANFGGRDSINGNGSRWMLCPYNLPAPGTTPIQTLGVVRLNTWTFGKTFSQGSTTNRGMRCGTKTSTCDLYWGTAYSAAVDLYERRTCIYSETRTNSTSDALRVGSCEVAGSPRNIATGINTGNFDSSSTGFGIFATASGANIIDGSFGCLLFTDGPLSAPEDAAVRAIYETFFGSDIVQTRKIQRIAPIGASIMRNQGATNYDGYRKYVFDQAVAAGYPLDFFGTTQDGTQADNWHSGSSGSDIADATTRWDLKFGTGNQFEGWAEWAWLSIGAADILNGTAGAAAADAYEVLVQHMITTSPEMNTFLVMTEPPIDGTSGQNAEMLAFNNALRNTGGKWDLLAAANPGVTLVRADLYAALGEVYDPADFVTGQNHPNDSGYAKLGPVIWAAMQSRLDAATTWI